MRRYHVTVAGQLHVIDVQEMSAQEFRVSTGGRELAVTLSGAEDVAEAVISPEMAPRAGSSSSAPSTASFRPVKPEALPAMVDAAPPPLPPTPDGIVAGAVKAPMPGTITAVEVQVGDEVKTGQVLVKLEAMKMVNAIRAPHDGRIAGVLVHPGESVGYGQVLATFEGA
jgi:biotin carboxyl carrier protein